MGNIVLNDGSAVVIEIPFGEPHACRIFISDQTCGTCGVKVFRLEPPVPPDWEYTCPAGQHLTVTTERLAALVAQLGDSQNVAFVSGIPVTRLRKAGPEN